MAIVPCKCVDWKNGLRWIQGCEAIAFVHGSVFPKDVPVFAFCPWCGTRLEIEKESKEERDVAGRDSTY